jgi:spore coat polysaccharide biosynthesis predicted glycosyltransferase SpsG
MGGSDPAGLTLMALEAIEMLDDDLHVLVALGCGFMHETALADLLFASKRSYEIRRDVSNMASLMAEADLSIASFGVTTYELAAIGVPMICVCLTKDHAEAARALVSEHAAISMGYYKEISSANLANMLKCVIQGDCASRMFARVSQIIDGLGAKRIASVISSHF